MSKTDTTYLLLGPETGEKDAFIETAIKRFEDERGGRTEIFKFFAFETQAVEIVSLLKNGLLFSDHKAVIVYGAESLGKPDATAVADYLGEPAPDALLFLCSDEVRFPHSKIEKAVLPGNKKIFWELLDHQKKGWIRNFFNRHGIRIEEEALEFIIDMTESTTKDLKATCERLRIFFSDRGEIVYDDIENYVYHGKEENVFTLFGALSKRDFSLSMEILNKILLSKEEDPVRILAGILWQVRQAIKFLSLLAERHSAESAFQKLSIRTKRQQRLYHQMRENYSLVTLFQVVRLIARCDVRLRSLNQNTHRFLLELFIYSMLRI
ncbi:MAG TPA: DNA polymerase III subunit delta [Spirochaetia bacterium]|nr:DNA polymerase III subunit delta [Spirochaetia bacterium]